MKLLCLLPLLVCLCGTLQAATNVVEVYFVVDRKTVENYMAVSSGATQAEKETNAKANIEADTDYFVAEINSIFKSANNYGEYGVDVEIRKRKLTILDSDIFSGSVVMVESGLPAFDAWLASEGAYNTLKYDHALLWTGYELSSTGSGTSTAGYAHVGSVCSTDSASSIVENDGTYHTVVTSAHEIAHNLGASHDGSTTGFVMAPTATADSANRWTFSICTASDIKATIAQLSTNCLLETNTASVASTSTVTAELENPDIVCRRDMTDSTTYMCKNSYFYNGAAPQGDEVCRELWCADPDNSGSCLTAFSSDGLPCGTNMRCNDGSCQADAIGGTESADSNCLFGDQATVKFNVGASSFQGSCTDFLAEYGTGMCSQSSVSSVCCSSCASASANSGSGTTASTGSSSSNRCQYSDQSVVTFTVNKEPFEGSCGEFIDAYGSDMCYYSMVEKACCETCNTFYIGVTGCEFGDKGNGCDQGPSNKDWICTNYGDLCCGYCHGHTGKRSHGQSPGNGFSPEVSVLESNMNVEELTNKKGNQGDGGQGQDNTEES